MRSFWVGMLLVTVLQGCMMAVPGRAMHGHMMGRSGHDEEQEGKANSKDLSEHEYQH